MEPFVETSRGATLGASASSQCEEPFVQPVRGATSGASIGASTRIQEWSHSWSQYEEPLVEPVMEPVRGATSGATRGASTWSQ